MLLFEKEPNYCLVSKIPIQLINKCLLKTYYVPDILLDTGDIPAKIFLNPDDSALMDTFYPHGLHSNLCYVIEEKDLGNKRFGF